MLRPFGQGDDGAVRIHQHAVLWGGILGPGDSVELPESPYGHVFVARGTATVGGHDLGAGDAARLTDERSLSLTAGIDESEILIWATS